MKIFFISYGTGGAEMFNIIYPLFSKEEQDKDVRNITISVYAKNKNQKSIFVPEENILKFLIKEKPDIIINERSNGLDIQNEISKFCKDNGILNICILDFFGNYKNRFTVVPDKVIVPSKSIYKDLLDFGFSETNLFIGGNASFDRFKNYKYDRDINMKNPHIVYTSQGFDRFYVFNNFYELINENFDNFLIDIKTHPQEDIKKWEEIISEYKNIRILNFNNKNDFLQECLNYDLIIGYNSTLQIQAYIIGIPVIFYELNDIEKAIQNFKNRVLPLQIHPYGDFEENAMKKNLKILNKLIKEKNKKHQKEQEHRPLLF